MFELNYEQIQETALVALEFHMQAIANKNMEMSLNYVSRKCPPDADKLEFEEEQANLLRELEASVKQSVNIQYAIKHLKPQPTTKET